MTSRFFTRILNIAAMAALVFMLAAEPARAQGTPPASATPAAAKPTQAAALPAGARIAFVNMQLVFSESEMGKKGQEQWRLFNDKLFANLAARDKEIQGLTDKIKTQQNLIDEAILRGWNNDLGRLQREAQFAQQEAQVQSNQMQQEVIAAFEKKVMPVLDALRSEKGLLAIVGVQSEPGGLTLLSSEPGMDLSAELIKRLNAVK